MKLTLLKVLICDDSMLIRKKLRDILQSVGINNISEASDGERAVQLYKENKPDITFMDIIMPFKTGIDALKEIREFDNEARVIMVTTVGTQGKIAESIKSGADNFIQKPFSTDDILRILNEFIKR